MNSLFNYVKIFTDVLPKETIDLFVSVLSEYENNTSPALVGTSDQIINQEYRITEWIPLSDDIRDNLKNSIAEFYNNFLIQTYKSNIKNIENPQFLYYNVGGKYDVHNDSEDWIDGKLTRVCNRDITILIYLNDNFHGGELIFPDYNVTITPKSGMIIAFPSYIEFSHKVNPISVGERFNIVSWIETESRIHDQWRNNERL